MPALGTAVISSSQFNQKTGHNSAETNQKMCRFLLKHFIPAIPLLSFFSSFYFFFQLSSLTFTSELEEGWLSPELLCAHKTNSQMNQPGLEPPFLLKNPAISRSPLAQHPPASPLDVCPQNPLVFAEPWALLGQVFGFPGSWGR